jgi:hypothetical protein
VVRTTVFWNVPRLWFGPQKSGPDQKFPVRTTKEWSGPDKVVQNSEKTSPWWFRPLFLVQTGKTWPTPSFSRLLRSPDAVVRGPVGIALRSTFNRVLFLSGLIRGRQQSQANPYADGRFDWVSRHVAGA